MTGREWWALASIVGVGAFVRLYRLDLTWFSLDQVRDLSIVAGIVTGRAFPTVGPAVGGTPGSLGPLYFYLISVPFVFTRDPLAGAAFVALLNVAAIVVLYRFTRDFFGPGAAWTASALFAVFPLAVISSRVLWNPGPLPLFTILFSRSLCVLVVRDRPAAIIGVLGLLAVLTQLHLTTFSLVPVAVAAILLLRPRVRPRHVAAGVAVVVLLYGPYIAHECAHGFPNIRSFAQVTSEDQSFTGPRAFPTVLKNLVLLFRPVLVGFMVERAWPSGLQAALFALYALESALFTLGVIICLAAFARRGRWAPLDGSPARRVSLVLLLWLGFPLVLLGLKRTVVWWYYLDVLYPCQFIFAGIAASALWSLPAAHAWVRRWSAAAFTGLLVTLVLAQTALQLRWQERVARHVRMEVEVARTNIGSNALGVGVLTPLFEVAGTHAGLDMATRPAVLSMLPLGFRQQMLRMLQERFGLHGDALWGRVHGHTLGLPEENEYLLRHLGSSSAGRERVASVGTSHVLVEETANLQPGLRPIRAETIGPYTIVQYQPVIDYESWSQTRALDGAAVVPETAWRRARLPWVGRSESLRTGDALLWRGMVRFPRGGGRVRLKVSVIAERPIDVRWPDVDGRRVAVIARSFQASPWVYWVTTSAGDIEGDGRAGGQMILISLAGTGRIMSVDVYEGSAR